MASAPSRRKAGPVPELTLRAVVFDLGGVFLDWDPRHLYRKLIADDSELEYFLQEICPPDWHAEQDLGRPIAESCAARAREYPEYAPLILAWAERNEEMVAGVMEGSVAILHELKAQGIACYALSNMEPEAFQARRRRYGFMSEFDGYVISGEENVAKPSAEIFRRLLERFSLDATAALFVDDRAVNIAAASQLGFQCVLFSGAAELRDELVGRGLLPQAQ